MKRGNRKNRSEEKTARKGMGGMAGQGDLIDMTEAIALLKTSRPTFYRWLRSGKIKGMKAGRQWRFYRSDIEAFVKGESPRIELAADIDPVIEILRTRLAESGIEKVKRADNKVRDVLQMAIALGAVSRASDIHITSHIVPGEIHGQGALRYRVDGVLHILAEFDIRLLAPIVEECKRLAACDLHERRKPQDGRIMIKLTEISPKLPDMVLDLRTCFLPSMFGEAVTFRILRATDVVRKLGDLPYNDHDRERLLEAIRMPWGIVICTGPTGCGKTTTLYACLQEIARPEAKVMSVEHPVEYMLPWVTQVQVRPDLGLDFPQILRSCLRSDPDVLMVGEIRDRDTVMGCIQAALTGHLVMTTLHTDDAVGALVRMQDIGVDPFLIGSSVKLVVAQRLIRKLCPKCATRTRADKTGMQEYVAEAIRGGLDWEGLPKRFRKAVGCEHCMQTGYRGRTVISEALKVTAAIEQALKRGAGREELRELAIQEGMLPMLADAMRRAALGETSVSEALRLCRVR